MPGFTQGEEDVAKAWPPQRRFRLLRWWFIVLLLLGLAAFAATVVSELRPKRTTAGPQSWRVVPLGSAAVPLAALALDTQSGGQQRAGTDEKQLILDGVLMLIALVTLLSLLATFFSRNPQTVATASDTLKTCLGFWIGSATKFL
jgi:hypothetical protein